MKLHLMRRLSTQAKILCAIMLTFIFSIIVGTWTNPFWASAAKTNATDSKSTFAVHFIDVGQADAALVLCDGKSMLIDGGNAEDSSLIYSYLKNLELKNLDYMICTHAHEDHVGGLSGALNYATVGKVYAPVTEYDSETFKSFLKYVDKQDKTITVPKAGDSFKLGSADIKILGPVKASDEPNNTSIVLKITYGKTSFLFTGDAERDEELDILAKQYDLSSTVLKVGHHGGDTSTSYPFLREIMPEYAVISVGKDNTYGHPTDDTLSRLRDADVKVYRTDLQGDIICTSDGKKVSFSVEKNADADTLAAPAPVVVNTETKPAETSAAVSKAETVAEETTRAAAVAIDYILNTNTKKFHYPSCSSVKQMKDKNKGYFSGTREEVIAKGYDPCGRCHP